MTSCLFYLHITEHHFEMFTSFYTFTLSVKLAWYQKK